MLKIGEVHLHEGLQGNVNTLTTATVLNSSLPIQIFGFWEYGRYNENACVNEEDTDRAQASLHP